MNPSATQSPTSFMDPTTAGLLSQLYPQQQQQTSTPTPAPTQAPQQSKGSFLSRLLPFGGSLAGGAGGAALGTAILPGIGTLIGGVLGAAAGGGVGKAGENVVEGNNVGQGVGQEALEGGVSQALGGGVGKLGELALGKFASLAGSGATKLIQGQAAKGALDSETANALRGMGITNLDQAGQISPLVTGSSGAISNGVKRGLAETNSGVDITGLDQTAQNILAENGATPGAIKAVGYNLTQATNNMLPGDVIKATTKSGEPIFSYSPGALQNALPENVFSQTQKMESLANQASNKAFDNAGNVINSDEYAKYQAYKGLAADLKSRAFGGDTPIPLSEENKAQIIQDLAPVKDINPTAYNAHVQQVTNAQNLQDLRPIQAPLVRANQAITATNNAVNNAGGSTVGNMVKTVAPVVGSAVAGPVGMAAGAVPLILGSNAADKAGAAILSKLSSTGMNPAVAKLVTPTLTAASQFVGHSPNYVSPSVSNTQQVTGGPTVMNPATGGGMVSPNQQALESALIGLQNPYMASTFAPIVQQLMEGPIQKSTSANTALQGAEQAFSQAGGGQGLVGGLLSRLGGALTGGPSQSYNAQRAQLIAQLNAMGVPTSAVPQLTNTPEAAAQQWATLQSLINSQGGQGLIGAVPAGA